MEESTLACTFCDTPIVPGPKTQEMLASIRQQHGLEASKKWVNHIDSMFAGVAPSSKRKKKKRRQNERIDDLNGKSGLYELRKGDLAIWTTVEVYSIVTSFTFELSAPLSIDGIVWVVPKDATAHRHVAELRDLAIPDHRASFELHHHDVYVEGDVDLDELAEKLGFDALYRNESLRVDPGGISQWRLIRSGFNPTHWFYKSWVRKRLRTARAAMKGLRESN